MSVKLVCPNCGPVRVTANGAGALVNVVPGPIPNSKCFRCGRQLHAVETDESKALDPPRFGNWPSMVGVILALFVLFLAAAWVSAFQGVGWALVFAGILGGILGWHYLRKKGEHSTVSVRWAIEKTVGLVSAGRLQEGEATLQRALRELPPSDQCYDQEAQDRFDVLMLLGALMEKMTPDPAEQLQYFDQCLELLDRLPLPPPGEDRIVNRPYQMLMNRANALNALGRLAEAEKGYEMAYTWARDRDTRCKCLTYQGWSILEQRNSDRFPEAETAFDQFDEVALGGSASPPLISLVKAGRAVMYVATDDLVTARDFCEEALSIDSSNNNAQILKRALGYDARTGKEILSAFFKMLRGPGEETPDPIKPLPKDF